MCTILWRKILTIRLKLWLWEHFEKRNSLTWKNYKCQKRNQLSGERMSVYTAVTFVKPYAKERFSDLAKFSSIFYVFKSRWLYLDTYLTANDFPLSILNGFQIFQLIWNRCPGGHLFCFHPPHDTSSCLCSNGPFLTADVMRGQFPSTKSQLQTSPNGLSLKLGQI